MERARITLSIDAKKHSQFKSICSLKHTNIKAVISEFVDQYLKDHIDWLPSEMKEIEK